MKLTTGVDFLCQQASSCLDKGKAELCPLTDLMFKKIILQSVSQI